MNFSLLDDNVIIYCILPLLSFKDRYLFMLTNKHINYLCKTYKYSFKENNDKIYDYFIFTIKNNLNNKFYILNECILGNFNHCQRYYTEDIEDGIYYFAKAVSYNEYSSIFYYYPHETIIFHNIYLIIFVYKNLHKTYIIKKFENHSIETVLNYTSLKYNEKIIKLY